MRYRRLLQSIAMASVLAAAATVAHAGQPITVESDQSQLVILPGIPGSVVIGNPTIADATVEGNKLFIHGRSFGTTNIMVMDLDGKEVANFDVSIAHMTASAVTLYRGNSKHSYNCSPLCESELQIGDDVLYNATVASQTKTKIELATGTDTAKSEAPPAPQ